MLVAQHQHRIMAIIGIHRSPVPSSIHLMHTLHQLVLLGLDSSTLVKHSMVTDMISMCGMEIHGKGLRQLSRLMSILILLMEVVG